MPYFERINTKLLGLSIDSNASHLAWMYDIYCRTGIKIPFLIIADRSGEIARKYGMISNDVSSTPANWVPGNPVIMPAPQNYCELEERQKYLAENNNGMSWYLGFKDAPEECENNKLET